MSKKFSPVTSYDEFHELIHNSEPIKSEYKLLIDDYKYLENKVKSAESMTDGEFDWWAIKSSQLDNILTCVYQELIALKGEEYVFKMLNNIDQNKRIQDLYDQIHDQRKLKIENDPKLQNLYEAVKQEKINAGRS